jgi:hypothetical protein
VNKNVELKLWGLRRVVQLVEHLAYNEEVSGSNPLLPKPLIFYMLYLRSKIEMYKSKLRSSFVMIRLLVNSDRIT